MNRSRRNSKTSRVGRGQTRPARAWREVVPYVAAVALWGVFLAPGLSWGLPNHRSFAVDAIAGHGRAVAQGRDLAKASLDVYPPLLFMVHELAFKVGRTGFSQSELQHPSPRTSGTFILIGRAVTSAHALALVLVVTWLARRWGGYAAAFFAPFLLATNPTVGYYARTTNVDLPSLLWWAAGLIAYRSAVKHAARWWPPMAFGLFAALAVTTKDQNAALYAVPIVHLFLIYGRRRGRGVLGAFRGLLAPRFWVMAAVGLAVFVGVYALGGGYARFHRHARETLRQSAGYFEFPLTPAGALRFLAALVGNLRNTLTWVMGILSVGSVAWLIATRRLRGWMAGTGGALAVYAVVMFVGARRVNPRFLLPAIVFAALVVGRAAAAFVTWRSIWRPVRWLPVACVGAGSAMVSVALSVALANNTRVQCRRMLTEQILAGMPGASPVISSFSASIGIFGREGADGAWKRYRAVRVWSESTIGVLGPGHRVRSILPRTAPLYVRQPDILIVVSTDLKEHLDAAAARRGDFVATPSGGRETERERARRLTTLPGPNEGAGFGRGPATPPAPGDPRPWPGRLFDEDSPFVLAATFTPIWRGHFRYLFSDPTIWLLLRRASSGLAPTFLLAEAGREMTEDETGQAAGDLLKCFTRRDMRMPGPVERFLVLMEAAHRARGDAPMPVGHAWGLIDVGVLQASAGAYDRARRCLNLAASCPDPKVQEAVAAARRHL